MNIKCSQSLEIMLGIFFVTGVMALFVYSFGDWSDRVNPNDLFKVGECVSYRRGTAYKIYAITDTRLNMVHKEEGSIKTTSHKADTVNDTKGYIKIKCSIVKLDDIEV